MLKTETMSPTVAKAILDRIDPTGLLADNPIVIALRERDEALEALRRLRWGVVANARGKGPRWARVMKATGFGSTSAHELCHLAGFDPDEELR